MKKETKTEKTFWVIIVILITLTIVIWGIMIYLEKPNFKITKEECWNITETIGKKATAIYNVTYPYRVRTYASDGHFIEHGYEEGYIKKHFPGCDTNYCHYSYWESCTMAYCWGVEYKIWKENFTETYENFEPILDTRTICKQVEVDKLVKGISNDCVSHSPTLKWAEENCVVYMNKQDLTIEWLFDNCVCEIFSEKFRDKRSFTNKEAMKYCEKYKCGEYMVKILK